MWDPSFTFKSYLVGLGGGVVAHKILVSAQGPLVIGFRVLWAESLGPGLDNFQFSCLSLFLSWVLHKMMKNSLLLRISKGEM